MLRRLQTAYFLVFVLLRDMFRWVLDDGAAEWKAEALLVCSEAALVFIVVSAAEVWTGSIVLLPLVRSSQLLPAVVVGFGLVGFNRALLGGRGWRRVEPTLERMPIGMRIAATAVLFVALVGSVFGAVAVAAALRNAHP